VSDTNIAPEQLLRLPEPRLKPNQTRAGDAADCRKIVNQVLQEDLPRSYFRAIVLSALNGAAPYSEKQRAENGGRWMANLNFMGLQAIMDQARIPYYALFSGVQNYCEFRTYYGEPSERQRWNDIIAEKWTKMVNTWKQFKWHMKESQFEMLFEGWGPVMWEDEVDWRFRAIPARNVLVPQRTESCLDHRVDFVVIRCAYRVHELFDKISDEKIARQRGWDVESVQWAIRNATKGVGGESWQFAPWEKWQQKFKDHEIWGSYTDADIINCAHVLVQEYALPGEKAKVSHLIVLEGSTGEAQSDKVGYLYKHANRYDSYSDAMVVCFQNTGNGTWHSVRGVGLKAFKHVEIENRLMCNQINNAMLAGMMVLQPNTSQSEDKAQNIKFGNGVAWIPPNTLLQQNRMGGDIQGPMAVQRMISNNLANNIGQYSGNAISREDGRGERATAAEVQYAEGKETKLTQGQMDAYYDDLDTIYENMFKRAVKGPDHESREFIQACLDEGVPVEALEQMECVKANRLSGYPSPSERRRNFASLVQLMPSLPEDGKNALLNEGISIFSSPDKIAVFNPPVQAPTNDTWQATIENDSLVDGMNPPIISGMNNVVHLKVHLDYADERFAPFKEAVEAGESIDPATLQTLYQYASVLGIHCEEHLSKMEGDQMRAGAAKFFSVQLKNLVAFHGKLRGAILDARRQAQQQALEAQQATALSVMDQAKLASMQAEQQRKDAVAVADQERKTWKAVEAQKLKAGQVSASTRLQGITTASKIVNDAAKTEAEIKNKERLSKSKPNGSK
jgi:hypothetical protein